MWSSGRPNPPTQICSKALPRRFETGWQAHNAARLCCGHVLATQPSQQGRAAGRVFEGCVRTARSDLSARFDAAAATVAVLDGFEGRSIKEVSFVVKVVSARSRPCERAFSPRAGVEWGGIALSVSTQALLNDSLTGASQVSRKQAGTRKPRGNRRKRRSC